MESRTSPRGALAAPCLQATASDSHRDACGDFGPRQHRTAERRSEGGQGGGAPSFRTRALGLPGSRALDWPAWRWWSRERHPEGAGSWPIRCLHCPGGSRPRGQLLLWHPHAEGLGFPEERPRAQLTGRPGSLHFQHPSRIRTRWNPDPGLTAPPAPHLQAGFLGNRGGEQGARQAPTPQPRGWSGGCPRGSCTCAEHQAGSPSPPELGPLPALTGETGDRHRAHTSPADARPGPA